MASDKINSSPVIRLLVKSQVRLSRQFDRLFPQKFRVDGQEDYQKNILPSYLKENQVIYDVGGGKRPYLNSRAKEDLNIKLVGLDIDAAELKEAPAGSYDSTVCRDIAAYRGNNDADLLICQSLLEHVKDIDSAFAAFASILKPGGLAIIFVPNRNALYARLNLLLPQGLKRSVLHAVYPGSREKQGFPAYYRKCTPQELKKLAREHGFEIGGEYYYYSSIYFSFFFPLHLFWRLGQFLLYGLFNEQAAETFTLVLKKR